MNRFVFSVFLFVLFSISSTAQEENGWDVNVAHGPAKKVTIETSEGTWMNLDVSPDGKWVVFDMLGDIFIIPFSGGEAKPLRTGHAWEIQPRFSPDGKKISFTSDAGGGDNIWVMDIDGSNSHQVTKENFRLLNNAVWTPDGNYLIARKHFTSTRSLGAGEMWMYHISGGEGVQLTKRKNDQQDVNEPWVSPDGKFLYFSEDMYPGGYFQYNKDPNNEIYVIRRYDLSSGELQNFITGPGGAIRPQVSHNGKYLAFVRRVRTNSVLFIKDLRTGQEYPIYHKLSKDQMEAWAIFGVYTNFNWTPDDQQIVIWANGKILKLDVFPLVRESENANAVEIPFKVKAEHEIESALRFQQNIDQDEFEAKVFRGLVTSPDKRFIVFNSVGYLWRKDLPDGKPQRISNQMNHQEAEASFSPDGSELLYVTWNDEQMGAIWKYNFKSRKAIKLTAEKGIYRTPRFSNDGKQIVFVKEDGNGDMGFAYCTDPGIYLMDADGKNIKHLNSRGENPQFSPDNNRIYYYGSGYPAVSYESIDLNGQDKKEIFTSKYATDFIPSPNGEWVAFRELHNVYVAAFPSTGKPIDLNSSTTAVPVTRVSRDAGYYMHWSADSKSLMWTLGDQYFAIDLNERFRFLEGAPDSIPPLDTAGIRIGLKIKADKPTSVFAFTGAKIITMKGDQIIEKGTIVIRGNKIEAIGKDGEVTIPKDALVKDLGGKVIMPGLVDVHAHVGHFRSGLTTQKHWPYYANLAYGVTTTHDPSSNTEMVFALSELVKSGEMVGPRIFSTGTILYGADGDFKAVINSLDDARSAIRRTMAFGAFSVKSYNQPRREQRQQVIAAARELKCMVVPEGGSTFYHNMTMILDGHTGIEHNIPVAPAYKDVIDLWKNSSTGYTPTLIVAYGAVTGEYYFYQHHNVWEKERLLRFTPRAVIDSRARHRTMIPEEEYSNGHILASQTCKTLSDQGVKVNLGAHGQLQGLGAHWELWMLAQGGMSNHEALRAATLNGAWYIGMDHQIGSLETGKMADLLILDKDPLEDIHNSESISFVMVNGRLFNAETMEEEGMAKKRNAFYWELPGGSAVTGTETNVHSHFGTTCSCRH